MSEAQTLALALREEPQAVMLTQHQLVVIANTDFVPKALRGNVAAVLACVARGRAMGIPDMVALNGISIIEGKATLTAELMSAIAREHGHSITGSVTNTEAIARGKRADNGDTMEVRFDLEMAKTAGLLNKFNWQKHPDDMLWARAVSKLCRRLFADCYAGGTYTPEEMEPVDAPAELTADEVIDTPAEVLPDTDSPPPEEKAGETDEPPSDDSPADLGAPEGPSGTAVFASGRYIGKTVFEVYESGDEGIRYLRWALKNWKSGDIVDALKDFARTHSEIVP